MPAPESGGVLNMWYSFNLHNVHFVQISTETDYPGAPSDNYRVLGKANGNFGNQLEWLAADLKRANENRHLRPWIIVNGHRPLYSVVK
jgi:acid phosphatase type 7